jgi:signal transduction histidine kinase
MLSDVLFPVGAWGLGEATRRWARRGEHLAAEAARAVADERVRIARDLHDIVAHHMSVISLHAGLAGYVISADLPAARTAIGNVEDASREALLDMRRLLDVLRVDRAGEIDLASQPASTCSTTSWPALEPSRTAHGLRGMRERVELYGGVLAAGPKPGGFTVVARIPFEADSSAGALV